MKGYKKTCCPLDCPDGCGLVATVENDRIVSLGGDPEHPYTRGVICRKMKRYHERCYSEKRVRYPLKRAGAKGDGSFTRISWDEAYDLLKEKIGQITAQYGGEAILPFVYAGNMGAINRFAGYPLFNKLGTSRLEETICSTAAKAGWKSHCGDIPGAPPEIAEDSELIVIWGSNTKVTNLHFWPYVAKARKKGAKIIVVDPYRTVTAASADLHLKVQPGEDTTLALGMIKLIAAREGLDRAFIESSTTGFVELENYLATLGLEELISRSGIEENDLSAFADLLGSSTRIFFRLGIGMTRNSRAGLGIRAITSLAASLGLFDGEKGRGVLMSSSAFKGDQQKLVWDSLAPKEPRYFNMVQLGNCLNHATPPVRMLMVYNANPLSVTPDSSLVRQALAREELFTVVHEQVITPTARYADLVLPATTFLENKDIYTGYGHFYLSIVDAVIEPVAEAKSNFDFFQELASRLGYTDPPFRQSLEERMMSYLSSIEGLPETFDPDDFEYGKPYHSTRSTKGSPFFSKATQLYHFSDTSDPLLPAIPCLLDGYEFDNADYRVRYPFKLIAPPHPDLLNSTFGEKFEGNPGELLIHPDDAATCDLNNGDMVTLHNDRGKTKRVVKITEDTRPGLLVAEGIFWESAEHPSGINDLASQNLTDMGGGGTFHESRVALFKTSEETF